MLVSARSDSQMRALGDSLAGAVGAGCVIFLRGPIGAGKTTLAQGLLAALGVTEQVTSPTFSLVEVYQAGAESKVSIWHFDLYRIEDPEELELIGVRESFNGRDIVIVEWPEKASGTLPAPDIDIAIEYSARIGVEAAHADGHNRASGSDRARFAADDGSDEGENGRQNGNIDTDSEGEISSNRRVTITGRKITRGKITRGKVDRGKIVRGNGEIAG